MDTGSKSRSACTPGKFGPNLVQTMLQVSGRGFQNKIKMRIPHPFFQLKCLNFVCVASSIFDFYFVTLILKIATNFLFFEHTDCLKNASNLEVVLSGQ